MPNCVCQSISQIKSINASFVLSSVLVKVCFFQSQTLFIDFDYISIFPPKSRQEIIWKSYFKVSQTKKGAFSTILNVQIFSFRQIRQTEMSILLEIAYNFGGNFNNGQNVFWILCHKVQKTVFRNRIFSNWCLASMSLSNIISKGPLVNFFGPPSVFKAQGFHLLVIFCRT